MLFFRVSEDAPIDERFEVDIDLEETELMDPDGELIGIRPRSGRVRIREPNGDTVLSVSGDTADRGFPLVLGAETSASMPLDAGQVTFLLPPELRGLPRTIDFDPRYGQADWTVSEPEPGRVVVGFTSSDGSLNRVPGTFLTMTIDTTLAQPGVSSIVIDESGTTLTAAGSSALSLTFESDQAIIFGDGFFSCSFELGDFSDWTSTVGSTTP